MTSKPKQILDIMELPTEAALKLYFSEVKDSQQSNVEFEDIQFADEVEQVTDFLHRAGLSDLPKLYHEGKEIPDVVVNESIRNSYLTEKQAQTIRSRVRTLNKTLRNRQPRRKQRQDVRDVAWNLESSSTGSRSRSATPDSLDSIGALNDESTSDEDNNISLTALDDGTVLKDKLKWTSSEPIQSKVFRRYEKGDVAHLGSDNVVLKGYHPLNDGTVKLITRERNNSDPSDEVQAQELIIHSTEPLSLPATNIPFEPTSISFEGLVKQQEVLLENTAEQENMVSIDDITDSEYQHLKPLLWVEVTTIFDHYKISILKRKPSTKHKRGNVFGVNLSTLVMRDMPIPSDNSMVPQVYQIILVHLNQRVKEDGILRIAGQKQKLEILCNEIETKFYTKRQLVEELLQEASVHDLTGVLKKLLRELPDPVFTMELFDMFYKCNSITALDDRVRALNILILLLPVEHRNTFKLLLQFFQNIIKHEENNRMSLHNVAMIAAPSFFPLRFLQPKGLKEGAKHVGKDQLAKEINEAAICCSIMELLLRTADCLWKIPAELVEQAQEAQKRAQNRKDKKDNKSKPKKKLQRSSTHYEPGAMHNPRIKRDFLI